MARADTTIDLSDGEKGDACTDVDQLEPAGFLDLLAQRPALDPRFDIDFDFGARKEIVKRPKGMSLQGSSVIDILGNDR